VLVQMKEGDGSTKTGSTASGPHTGDWMPLTGWRSPIYTLDEACEVLRKGEVPQKRVCHRWPGPGSSRDSYTLDEGRPRPVTAPRAHRQTAKRLAFEW